jgi:hypothetical protein
MTYPAAARSAVAAPQISPVESLNSRAAENRRTSAHHPPSRQVEAEVKAGELHILARGDLAGL